ncbi:DUF4147 domain-containing protein [Candidatus Saccharibacteria bacterium]|nr:DUF4147 domain-containing protein [Candidatus Saccharibacteria bacterium]
MIIKNSRKLGNTDLRCDALRIAEAGYEALELKKLFQNDCIGYENTVCFRDNEFDLTHYKKIYIVGMGKGSASATQQLLTILPKRKVKGGVVIDITKKRLGKIKSYIGTHPLPSEKNILATSKAIEVLKQTTKDDLVITIICGGGSSLFCQPGKNTTCLDLQIVGDHLLKSGAKIQEMNTVRKHLSYIHGGNLAKYAYPATIVSLIISDVPGNDLEMIASGPTVMDTTSVHDAQKIATQYDLGNLNFVETPKDLKYFTKVHNIVLASGWTAIAAMREKAIELGYKPVVYSKALTGYASKVGPNLARAIKPGEALLACGETQVNVTHPGKGGRNQDVALSALPHLPKGSVIISAASDGKDNIPVAGAITDSAYTGHEIKQQHVDPTEAVALNQSYTTLEKVRGIFTIKRHITANVSDFIVLLSRKP